MEHYTQINSSFQKNQEVIGKSPENNNISLITIKSSQVFNAKIVDGKLMPITISQENEMGTAGGGSMEANPGSEGVNTYTFTSAESGNQLSSLVNSTWSADGGGESTGTVYETPYSTEIGAIFQVPDSDIDPDNPDYKYILVTNKVYTSTDDVPSSVDIIDNGSTYGLGLVACFVSGTVIRTPHGDVAVEHLKAGDLVLTASGAARPVRWVGSHHIAVLPPYNGEQARNMWPVRIVAHAFGQNLPDRDLFVSPGHSIAVKVMDEVFTQAIRLVNGTTIRQEARKSVTYWHIELDSHDVLISNNLPTESYLDVGNRALLGLDVPSLAPVASVKDYARPLVENGPIVEAIRTRLTARAKELGWHVTDDADMHLVVDGHRFDAVRDGNRACFIFPVNAQNVQLVSRTFIPAETSISEDCRSLGVSLISLHVRDGLYYEEDVTLAHPSFDGQFHPLEGSGSALWRWTKGTACLDTALWAKCKGQVILTLTLSNMNANYWHLEEHEKTYSHLSIAG